MAYFEKVNEVIWEKSPLYLVLHKLEKLFM